MSCTTDFIASSLSLLNDSIPFKFQDTNTYFDIYFDKENNRLKAFVSFLNEKEETEFSIYTIDYPIYYPSSPTNRIKTSSIYYVILAICFITFLLLSLKQFKKLKNKTTPKLIVNEKPEYKNPKTGNINDFKILFFGGFKIFNNDNEEIKATIFAFFVFA